MKLKGFWEVNEALATNEVDPTKFPNPQTKDKDFLERGRKDGDQNDDVVFTKKASIPAKQLKPSQDAVYLGKALGMAIGGVSGGDLDAVISADNRILDGHHRWAATMFNNPGAKVNGVQSDLKIGDLIPVLRGVGDALGNKRGLAPAGGDVNIFKATIDDVENSIYNGDNMDPKYYNKEKAIEWYEKTGRKSAENALKILQRVGPPAGAPPRSEMPKITPNQVDKVSKALNKGGIDTRAPYVNENKNKTMKNLESFDEFVNEGYLNENRNRGMAQAAVQVALKGAGHNLKQKEFKFGAKKDGLNGLRIYLNGEVLGYDGNWDSMVAKFQKYIEEDPAKYGLNERYGDSLDHEIVMAVLDVAGMYTSDANPAASQQWNSIEELAKYIKGDFIAKKWHKKFDEGVERVKQRHNIKESVNEAYTEAKLKKLLKTLGGESEDDSAAWDIADGILYDEKGLEDYLRKKKGISDPQGWLANYV